MPPVAVTDVDEVLFFIERYALMGCGMVMYADVHLLEPARLLKTRLWIPDSG